MPEAPTVSNSSCLIGLEAAGHLDILQQLYRGILSNVRDIIDALAAANFRVSDTLVQEILRQAGE